MKALVAAALLAVVPASPPGAAFSSVSLTSVASGASWVFGNQAHDVPAEMDVPYAASQVLLGQGQATATVAWPGETGASLGSTLIVGFNAPEQARLLNDPAYARAQSGKGPATVTNNKVPSGTMVAHATTTEAKADSSVDGASALATTIGSAKATSTSAVTGRSAAQVSGASTVRDVSIAGVVHVDAVTSLGTASTDGQHAQASGGTTVSGLSVAGQAVTIDEHGITVAGHSLPAGAALDAVEQALAKAQITLTLSAPVKSAHDGTVEYASGSLIISTPLGVLSLGGVSLRASATPVDVPVIVNPPPVMTSPPSAPPGVVTTPNIPGIVPSGPTPLQEPTLAAPVGDAMSPLSLVTGFGPIWVVVGLLLCVCAAAGVARLPGLWLPVRDDQCPLERPL
jgi:hypothetical protein